MHVETQERNDRVVALAAVNPIRDYERVLALDHRQGESKELPSCFSNSLTASHILLAIVQKLEVAVKTGTGVSSAAGLTGGNS